MLQLSQLRCSILSWKSEISLHLLWWRCKKYYYHYDEVTHKCWMIFRNYKTHQIVIKLEDTRVWFCRYGTAWRMWSRWSKKKCQQWANSYCCSTLIPEIIFTRSCELVSKYCITVPRLFIWVYYKIILIVTLRIIISSFSNYRSCNGIFEFKRNIFTRLFWGVLKKLFDLKEIK